MARRRRRGEGSVFFDHDAGTWVAVVSLGVINGKRTDQLGNTPAIVAKTYSHVVPDVQRAAVNSLERRSG